MKTDFPVITFTELVENQGASDASFAALFRDYYFQRVGEKITETGVQLVEIDSALFPSLLQGENAMLKRAFHESPRQVGTLLLLKSKQGKILIFFDIESPDCGDGLCRFLTPLAKTEYEQAFVRSLVFASQIAKRLNRMWVEGGRQFHSLKSSSDFDTLYPKESALAAIEPEDAIQSPQRTG